MKTVTELARKAGHPQPGMDKIFFQRLVDLAIAQYRESMLARVGEPIAYMYPNDLERMTTTETFCTVFSVMVGSQTQGLSTVECYTADQLVAAVAIERENVLSLVNKYSKANMENDNVVALLDHLAAAIRGQL